MKELSKMLSGTGVLSTYRAEKFLDLGRHTLDSHSSAVHEQFVKAIATETGLHWIVNFVEAVYETQTGIQDGTSMRFWNHCVPFLNLITHERLRGSLLFEKHVGTMYNMIYGHSGARAVPFFRSVVDHLAGTTNINVADPPDFWAAVSATARALLITLKVNQSALAQEEFINIVQRLRECFPMGPSSDSEIMIADTELGKVEQHLQMAETIPMISPSPPHQHKDTPSDSVSHGNVDLPGKRSINGPRHDNDSAWIECIKILPTKGEIMSTSRTEYLPFRNYSPTAHHLPPGIGRVLDTQFRLLREDTAGQIRDTLRSVMRRNLRDANIVRQSNTLRTMIYTGVMLENFQVGARDDFQLVVTFDQPPGLLQGRPNATQRRKWWEAARCMEMGALLCLVDQQNEFTFLTVSERELDTTDVQITNLESIKKPKGLSGHPTRALVTLKFVDVMNDLQTILREYRRQRKHNHKSRQYPFPYLVEFPGILFSSFGPILESIQNINVVPFTRFIAPEGNDSSDHPAADIRLGDDSFIDVPPPSYLSEGEILELDILARDRRFNLEQIPELSHSIDQPCKPADLEARTTLDRGQCDALIAALSQELVLIQGPPGTGKSYVGIQLVRVLVHHNRYKKFISLPPLGPILCV